MTTEISFNLTTEPWIPARLPDGAVLELSLRDTFAQAHDIQDLVGEVPTQVFAITRLLLAILHRSLPEINRPVDDWIELWNEPKLLTELIDDYLCQWSERFDLLHPETPFYQVAQLHTKKGEVSGLEKLIADVPNGEPFFTTRRDRGVGSISVAEAARWLVHVHAFDVSGIKSGADGDDRVKGGKGYPIGTGWAGELGGVLLEGRNLKETLLLNLVLGDDADTPFAAGDLPSWEREPQTGAVEFNGKHEPTGQIELFTWQSRRVRLVHDGAAVTGVLIANGDALRPQNLFRQETMTAWRRSKPQETKLRIEPVYMPRTHNPERSFWRGLSALFPEIPAEGYAAAMRPGNLQWISTILAKEDGLHDISVRTHAYGISYGTQSSTVDEIIDDAFMVHSALISDTGRELTARVVDVIAATEQAVDALGHLAGNLAIAAGGDNAGPRDRARERAYFAIDPQFRRWLAALDIGVDVDNVLVDWRETARTIIRRQAEEIVDASGPAAWIGREAKIGGVVNTPKAYEWFLGALYNALPEPQRGRAESEERSA
ncbi:MAG: type I-E CRISPR-associated protein Cse1/CasA [Microbacteriaceae bacterium]|nr:MAG: type I-E CRISPR-associated protein Cse1/CasA [Microbacteriaceae bacterium]